MAHAAAGANEGEKRFVRDATGRGWPELAAAAVPASAPRVSPRPPSTLSAQRERESRWSARSRYCLTAEGGTVSTFASQSEGGDWWAWAPEVPRPSSLQHTQSHAARMPWINTKVSSKDSLAVRQGQNETQQNEILARSQRKDVVPISFFTDLSGKERMIKASSLTPNNPFHSRRNPLPVGFGLHRVDHAEPPSQESVAQNSNADGTPGPLRLATPTTSQSRQVCATWRTGNIARQLVLLQVEEAAAARAARATGYSTVAAAMRWLLDNDQGAVANLEQRWCARARTSSSTARVHAPDLQRARGAEVSATSNALKRHEIAQRFLAGGERFSGGHAGRLGPGGWLVGGFCRKPACSKGPVKGYLESSDAGSIHIYLQDSASAGASSPRPQITVIPQ